MILINTRGEWRQMRVPYAHLLDWRYRSMSGRRCELFRMGLFAGFLNIVTTVHTGDDASYVYECIAKPNE